VGFRISPTRKTQVASGLESHRANFRASDVPRFELIETSGVNWKRLVVARISFVLASSAGG